MAKTVIIIDPDQASNSLIRDALAGSGADIKVYDEGISFLTELEAGSFPNPALLVICVEIEGKMNGYFICKKIKSHETLCAIPVLLISLKATPETFMSHQKLKTRADWYLHKPLRAGELEGVLKEAGLAASDEEFMTSAVELEDFSFDDFDQPGAPAGFEDIAGPASAPAQKEDPPLEEMTMLESVQEPPEELSEITGLDSFEELDKAATPAVPSAETFADLEFDADLNSAITMPMLKPAPEKTQPPSFKDEEGIEIAELSELSQDVLGQDGDEPADSETLRKQDDSDFALAADLLGSAAEAPEAEPAFGDEEEMIEPAESTAILLSKAKAELSSSAPAFEAPEEEMVWEEELPAESAAPEREETAPEHTAFEMVDAAETTPAETFEELALPEDLDSSTPQDEGTESPVVADPDLDLLFGQEDPVPPANEELQQGAKEADLGFDELAEEQVAAPAQTLEEEFPLDFEEAPVLAQAQQEFEVEDIAEASAVPAALAVDSSEEITASKALDADQDPAEDGESALYAEISEAFAQMTSALERLSKAFAKLSEKKSRV